jgi:DNA-binding NtrC family response regulator
MYNKAMAKPIEYLEIEILRRTCYVTPSDLPEGAMIVRVVWQSKKAVGVEHKNPLAAVARRSGRGPRSLEGEEWRPLSLDDVRKVHIQRVLAMCQGNRLHAAQILGIGRTSLYRYLKRDGQERRAPEKSGRGGLKEQSDE